MFRRIYRQRRHAYLATLLVLLGAVLKGRAEQPGLLTWLFSSDWVTVGLMSLSLLIVILGFMLVVAIFCALVPIFATLPEQLGLIALMMGIVATFWPNTYELQILRTFLPYLLALCLIPVLYADTLSRFTGWTKYNATGRFRSKKSAEELWDQLVVKDDGLALSIIDEVTPTDDPNVRQVRLKIGNGLFVIRREEIIRSDKPFYHSYKFEALGNARNKARNSGIATIEIKPRAKGGCDVYVSENRERIPLFLGLLLWSNDAQGSYVDHMSARDKGHRDWSNEGQNRRKFLADA